MNESSKKSEREEFEEARQMQHWVHRYAQNRSLGVVVALAIFSLLFIAIAAPSYWGGMAYRNGNVALLTICVGVLAVAVAGTIYFSVPRWGGQLLERVVDMLYAREGRVTISVTHGKHTRLIAAALGVAFGMCVVGSVLLGFLGYLPDGKYMQPISALYVVPFLVGLNFLMRPAAGYIPLLWPALYALHAVLIVAGAPIVFTGPREGLNMVLPIVGYGLLASLASHLYSRWALHNIRMLATDDPDGTQQPPAGDGI